MPLGNWSFETLWLIQSVELSVPTDIHKTWRGEPENVPNHEAQLSVVSLRRTVDMAQK